MVICVLLNIQVKFIQQFVGLPQQLRHKFHPMPPITSGPEKLSALITGTSRFSCRSSVDHQPITCRFGQVTFGNEISLSTVYFQINLLPKCFRVLECSPQSTLHI